MLYGIAMSGTGAQIERAKLENISNNLANINTHGFKQDLLTVMQRPTESRTWLVPEESERALYADDLLDRIGGGVWLHQSHTILQEGPLSQTGNNFDFAVQGQGFFTVQDVHSQATYFTRAGNFHINSEGLLQSADGEYVLLDADGDQINAKDLIGDNGDGELVVNTEGLIQVKTIGGSTVDTGRHIGLVIFDKEDAHKLAKFGHNVFVDYEGSATASAVQLKEVDASERHTTGQIRQGFLEASGADPIMSLKNMMETSRGFERNMNLISLQNSTLQQLISQVGSVS